MVEEVQMAEEVQSEGKFQMAEEYLGEFRCVPQNVKTVGGLSCCVTFSEDEGNRNNAEEVLSTKDVRRALQDARELKEKCLHVRAGFWSESDRIVEVARRASSGWKQGRRVSLKLELLELLARLDCPLDRRRLATRYMQADGTLLVAM